MKHILALIFLCFAHLVISQPSATELLKESIKYHDPNNQWTKSIITVEIDEPRQANPQRHSKVYINKQNQSFYLERPSDKGVLKWELKQGVSLTYLDTLNSNMLEKSVIDNYRLQPDRTARYFEFYDYMLGLPMSISKRDAEILPDVEIVTFNGQEAYKITLVFSESLISKSWSFYFTIDTKQLVGASYLNDQTGDPSEYIIIGSEYVDNKTLKIPRFRHWYKSHNQEYLGSDIILNVKDGV